MKNQELHTHYDNLKVVRSAPLVVIRAAYKALSQVHHPDKNPGDESAVKVMEMINVAYEVLSNPQKKEKYDQWLKEQEGLLSADGQGAHGQNQSGEHAGHSYHATNRTQSEASSDSHYREQMADRAANAGRYAQNHSKTYSSRTISPAQSKALVIILSVVYKALAVSCLLAVATLAVVFLIS